MEEKTTPQLGLLVQEIVAQLRQRLEEAHRRDDELGTVLSQGELSTQAFESEMRRTDGTIKHLESALRSLGSVEEARIGRIESQILVQRNAAAATGQAAQAQRDRAQTAIPEQVAADSEPLDLHAQPERPTADEIQQEESARQPAESATVDQRSMLGGVERAKYESKESFARSGHRDPASTETMEPLDAEAHHLRDEPPDLGRSERSAAIESPSASQAKDVQPRAAASSRQISQPLAPGSGDFTSTSRTDEKRRESSPGRDSELNSGLGVKPLEIVPVLQSIVAALRVITQDWTVLAAKLDAIGAAIDDSQNRVEELRNRVDEIERKGRNNATDNRDLQSLRLKVNKLTDSYLPTDRQPTSQGYDEHGGGDEAKVTIKQEAAGAQRNFDDLNRSIQETLLNVGNGPAALTEHRWTTVEKPIAFEHAPDPSHTLSGQGQLAELVADDSQPQQKRIEARNQQPPAPAVPTLAQEGMTELAIGDPRRRFTRDRVADKAAPREEPLALMQTKQIDRANPIAQSSHEHAGVYEDAFGALNRLIEAMTDGAKQRGEEDKQLAATALSRIDTVNRSQSLEGITGRTSSEEHSTENAVDRVGASLVAAIGAEPKTMGIEPETAHDSTQRGDERFGDQRRGPAFRRQSPGEMAVTKRDDGALEVKAIATRTGIDTDKRSVAQIASNQYEVPSEQSLRDNSGIATGNEPSANAVVDEGAIKRGRGDYSLPTRVLRERLSADMNTTLTSRGPGAESARNTRGEISGHGDLDVQRELGRAQAGNQERLIALAAQHAALFAQMMGVQRQQGQQIAQLARDASRLRRQTREMQPSALNYGDSQ